MLELPKRAIAYIMRLAKKDMLARLPFRRHELAGGRPPGKFATNLAASGFLLVMIIFFASKAALSQQTHVLLDDNKALVTQVEIPPNLVYALPKGQRRSIWIAIDPVLMATSKEGLTSNRTVPCGRAELIASDEKLQFNSSDGLSVRLVIVKANPPHQELTLSPFILSHSIEDASNRNATLLIAISNCRFSDIQNLGEESEWIPSKPRVVVMKPGDVRWIRPGIHHFKNLDSAEAHLVSIEW